MVKFCASILDLVPPVAVGPHELANALCIVASAGFRGSDALDILETSAKAAAVGPGDTAVVANAITSAVNAHGAANLTAARAAEILITTVRDGKIPAEELGGVPSRGWSRPASPSRLCIDCDEPTRRRRC